MAAQSLHLEALGQEVFFGKLPVKKDDRNLLLTAYVEDARLLPQVPDHVQYSDKVTEWPMYGNDTLPDCTCAAAGHMEEAWSANAGAPEVPPDSAVLGLFNDTGPQNEGRACLDILNYWRHTGLDGEQILAYAQVDPTNRDHVKAACWLFGGVYIGLELPNGIRALHDWRQVPRGPDGEPNPHYGHCVNLVNYDATGATCVTWGRLMPLSWDFFDRYCVESYAVLSPDWASPDKDCPAGFKLQDLQSDLSGL
jgi:hypothetical protein